MTQSAATLLDRRLARIAIAKRQEAIALFKERGVVDAERADMVIAFKGKTYAATTEAIRKFGDAGITIRWPHLLRVTRKIASFDVQPPPAAPALPRVEQVPVPPAASPLGPISERDKWVLQNTAPALRTPLPSVHT